MPYPSYLSAILQIVVRRFASISASTMSISASIGFPEREHQNCLLKILQTSFDTGVLPIHLLHTHALIVFLLEQPCYLFDNKRVKYFEKKTHNKKYNYLHCWEKTTDKTTK